MAAPAAAASAAPASSILEAYSGRKPKAPLPPIILSNVPGTWAYDTMSRRIRDDILARIYAGARAGWGRGRDCMHVWSTIHQAKIHLLGNQ